MDNIETILERFVDDRDQLTDEELDELVEAAGSDGQLAARLKDQLIIDELLAQRLAIDRRYFVAQVAQRIRDDEVGLPPPAPADRAVADEMRALVDVELASQQKLAQRRRAHRRRWVAALAALVLLAGSAVWWWRIVQQPIAVVVEFSGEPTLLRGNRAKELAKDVQLHSGDQLSMLRDESITLRFRDGTELSLDPDTAATIHGENSRQGKCVVMAWGTLTADVAAQPAGRPMQFETPNANITVRGTLLRLAAHDERTRLDVIEGVVELARKSDGQRVAVSTREYAVATNQELAVKPLSWPIDRRDALVLLETTDTTNLVRMNLPDEFEKIDLRPAGAARQDHNFALVLGGGSYGLNNASAAVLNGCRESGELTIEATITPEDLKQSGPAGIVACRRSLRDFNFILGQEENRLLFRLRTSDGGVDDIELCRLSAGQPQHIAVTYRPGLLACYLNGRRVYSDGKVRGDLTSWERYPITVGDVASGGHDWAGTLEGLAIYDRALEEDEIRRNAQQYRSVLARRPKVPQFELVATLVETSPIPALAEILPQESALVVCRYRVDEVISGDIDQKDILVAEWAILDSQPQTITALKVGASRRLTLERLGPNAQLEGVIRIDEFRAGDDPQKPRYYNVGAP